MEKTERGPRRAIAAVVLPSAVWYHCFAGYRRKRRVPHDALYCEGWATAWGRTWSGM